MKFTDYFWFMRQRPDRSFIEFDWIQQVIDHPARERYRQIGAFGYGANFRDGWQVSEGYAIARQGNGTQRIS